MKPYQLSIGISVMLGASVVTGQVFPTQQASKKQTSNNGPKGPVQITDDRLIKYSESLLKRTPVGTVISWRRTIYDKDGTVIERITLGRDGVPESIETLRRDERGNLVEVISRGKDGVGHVRETRSYDERGNQTEQVFYDNQGNIKVKVKRKYDLDNRLVEQTRYEPSYAQIANGDTVRINIKYNDQSREDEQLKYDGSNRLIERRLIKRNLDNTTKEEICENPIKGYSVCPFWKRAYKYDDHGNETEQGSYEKDREAYKIDFLRKYDELGNQIEFVQPGRLRILYSYDAKGNKVESAAFNQEGRLVSKTKYDSANNEVVHASLRNGVLEQDFYDREYDIYGNLIRRTWRKKTYSQSDKPLLASDWLKDSADKGKIVEVAEVKISYFQ